MNPFKRKIAIVTGGASGIGRGICEELGKMGAIVTVADINAEGAKELADNITARGGQARAAQLNVAVADEVKRVIEDTHAEHGRLDFIFNNAGVLIVGEAFEMSIEDWDRIFDINLKGVTYGTAIAY